MTTDQAPLPGLVLPQLTGQDGPMAQAARITLESLAECGGLEPRHTVLVQLVQSLAGAIDRGVASGRASAVAMAAKQLLETMLVLDPPPEGPKVGDAAKRLDAFFQRIEDHANGSGA